MNSTLADALAIFAATFIVQAVDKWLVSPRKTRKIAEVAAEAAITKHERKCPGASILQPIAVE